MRNKLILAALFVVVAVSISCLRIDQYLTFEQFQIHRDHLQQWVSIHPILSPIVLGMLYLVAVTFAIPTGGIMTVVGGYFLGVGVTALAVVVGATLGAMMTFLIARYILRDTIEQKFGDRIHVLNDELEHHGTNYLLSIRLLPFMPFFILNPILGLTRVQLNTFLWTTAVGIAPGTLLYAFAGKSLSEVQNLHELLWSWQAIGALLMLALMALLPLIMRKVKKAP